MIDVATVEELGKAQQFLKTEGKKILFYHQDADGICSASILMKFFPDFEAIPREGPRMEEEFPEWVIGKKPKLIVFLDLAVDQRAETIQEISRGLPDSRILIVDHHIPENNLNSDNILHINHMFRQKIYIPTSYQIFWILQKLDRDMEGICWISVIGIIGDYGFRECKDFLSKCRARYPELLYDNPLESRLGKAAEMIASAVTLKGAGGARKSVDVLLKSKEYEDFAKDDEMIENDKIVKEEIDGILKDFAKKKEEHLEHDLIIYELKSKLNLSSVIASILARLYPDDIIIVRKHSMKGWKLSLRTQTGKVNVGCLTKKCVKGIGAGGGHEKAAGALVDSWDTFKHKFIQELSSPETP